jgi:hypothetical protein
MDIIKMYLQELGQEAKITHKMLERIPNDKYDWQPHAKSMNIKTLATHIADLPSWITMALTTEEPDFAAIYQHGYIGFRWCNGGKSLGANFRTTAAYT